MKKLKAPSNKEVDAIPKENWVAWLKAEYNHECCEPDYVTVTTNKEEMGEEHQDKDFMISFKTFCIGLNQTYCDVTPEQYEKIKSGFYNDQLDTAKSDVKKMLDFMKYKKKYEHDDTYYVNEDREVIMIDSNPTYSFRPDLNWKDLHKVIDYIDSRPSTLMTSIEYLDSDRHKYTFKILMQDGVTREGLTHGTSNKSKIDAAYKGVMNYINWRIKLDEEDGKD